MQFSYLNTDLDLSAEFDLDPLAAALESLRVFPLHVTQGEDGAWYSTFELLGQEADPETTIVKLLDAIEALDETAQDLWSKCSFREFNIGYEGGQEPGVFSTGLDSDLLARIALLGASLRVTVYPPEPGMVLPDEVSESS